MNLSFIDFACPAANMTVTSQLLLVVVNASYPTRLGDQQQLVKHELPDRVDECVCMRVCVSVCVPVFLGPLVECLLSVASAVAAAAAAVAVVVVVVTAVGRQGHVCRLQTVWLAAACTQIEKILKALI